ncbi:MAG: hypothetical protein J0M10_12345 [Chitinophagales bacterium]|nr:hypothetical protein [Chitinophagales bacterium]
MNKNFIRILFLFFSGVLAANGVAAQCAFTAAVTTQESRCMSTGIITVTTTGGSGNFNYKITGPVPPTVTSSNVITGLPPGAYTIEVTDLEENCTDTLSNVIVAGNYQDPRFQLQMTDATCFNASNGSLTAFNIQYGRSVFNYTIVAPSATGIGTSNSTGLFNGLPAGSYTIRLTDSCGGLQTRTAVIANYTWWISTAAVAKSGCDSADVLVTVTDSKGNTNSSNPALFSAFSYGVSKAPGDTIWYPARSFRFYLAKKRRVAVVVKDGCGNYSSSNWTDNVIPSIGGAVSVSNKNCTDFRATITSKLNLTNPEFKLYNSANVLLATNGIGVFSNLAFGSYCITMTDACYDTTISRCFTENRYIPSVSASVSNTNRVCATFTASVTGQTNLTNPQYCLYDNLSNLIGCNSTGIFNNLAYGAYCITVRNDASCYDTLITRCFTATRPVPSQGAAVSISSRTCTTFTATAGGNTNVNNPQYCIYTSGGVLITCNTTGVFTNLPYGSYCINMRNDPLCYDTTIVRCFTELRPVPSVSATVSQVKSCSTFNASVTGQVNLTNPNYCLYDNSNTLLLCNSTGVFNNLAYGSYTIRIQNDPSCYDTLIVRSFTAAKLIPSVGASVSISNRSCSDFRAQITGQVNLLSPNYCLYDAANALLGCNSTGQFNNLAYGSYCIRITTPCYDTTISRCFTVAPTPFVLSVTSSRGCTNGYSDITASFTAGVAPFTLQVYNPGNQLVKTIVTSSASVLFNDLPVLPGGLGYTFISADACAGRDTVLHVLNGLAITKNILANSKCPGGTYPNGSGDLVVNCTNNAGVITPKIIKRDGLAYVMNATSVSGSTFTFSNLGPANYIVEYSLHAACTNKYYDTFQLKPYVFPSLGQSAVFQCANNNFNVNAAVVNGIAPFTYEIQGSLPAMPSIVTAPQAAPMFNISNGVDYSLVNLRAIDACGNGTLNDVPVLPLANTIINSSSNCFYNNILLTVPVIPNATYTWFKKTSATDSIQVGTSSDFNIPYLMPADTGIYVCRVNVNGGCLTRLSYYTLNGDCGGMPLAVNDLELKGALQGEQVQLKWTTEARYDATHFVIERKTNSGDYIAIGRVNSAVQTNTRNEYYFSDINAPEGVIQYRLRTTRANGTYAYSNIVKITKKGEGILSISPNPVYDQYVIRFGNEMAGQYLIRLLSLDGRLISTTGLQVTQGTIKTYQRPVAAKSGIYLIDIHNVTNGVRRTEKVVFQ